MVTHQHLRNARIGSGRFLEERVLLAGLLSQPVPFSFALDPAFQPRHRGALRPGGAQARGHGEREEPTCSSKLERKSVFRLNPLHTAFGGLRAGFLGAVCGRPPSPGRGVQ